MENEYYNTLKKYGLYRDFVLSCEILDAYIKYLSAENELFDITAFQHIPYDKNAIEYRLEMLKMISEGIRRADFSNPYIREDDFGFRYNKNNAIVCCPKSFYDDAKERYEKYQNFFAKYIN